MRFELFDGDIFLLDGAMGTVLQRKGLAPGGVPDLLNITDGALISSIHREYIDAGSRAVYTNTFGTNSLKLAPTGRSVAEVVSAAVAAARAAAGDRALVALDMGPLGRLMEPLGSLTFEEAYELYREQAEAGAAAGADLAVIETISDLSEARAALLAVKEATGLPVIVTMSFEERGRSFTGCAVPSMARTLEGLGADALGFNCSLGPDKLLPLLRELSENTTLPMVAKPNAGLPDPATGEYGMGPEDFAAALLPCLEYGVTGFGGCCGTSPEYIAALERALRGKRAGKRRFIPAGFVCTAVEPVFLDGVRVVGERINPTGKKRLRQALLEDELDYVLDLGVQQQDAGADLLDVNVGCPGADEKALLPRVVKKLQSALSIPLQLDSSDPEALAAGLRVYCGKAAVNSVNASPESLAAILPVAKKYGAAVVGLTTDENGLPNTAGERTAIARRILEAALSYGIPREDVYIDCLALTVSAQQEQAEETLKALREIRYGLGLQCVLGVSNISFGLPSRQTVTRAFLSAALAAGLTLPIMNPCQSEMMDAVAAHRVLSGEDWECRAYIARFADAGQASVQPQDASLTLEQAVVRGLRAEAGRLARAALETEDELSLVERRLIPALDTVGSAYERGVMFLPQLLSAAEAAQSVFEAVRASVTARGGTPVKKGTLALATVRGDIHDIGKNIVKTVLENYGYEALDLGRDVPPEAVAAAVRERGLRLVGLSALMTTTLPAMEETVRLLKALPAPPAVMVGGAVLTADFAAKLGADYYARDAAGAVEIARKVFG